MMNWKVRLKNKAFWVTFQNVNTTEVYAMMRVYI